MRRLIGAVQIEVAIDEDSPLAGRELREIALPEGSVITIIHRDAAVVIPRGNVTLQVGDQLTILSEPAAEAAVRRLLAEVVHSGNTQASREDRTS